MLKNLPARLALFASAAVVVIQLNTASYGTEAAKVDTAITSALATGKPGMNSWPHDDPGSTKALPRTYIGAPPRIPHNAVDFTITRGDNDCVYCHIPGADLGDGHVATKIPATHFANSFTGERRDTAVVGIRYNCRQCHVPEATGSFPEGAFAPGS